MNSLLKSILLVGGGSVAVGFGAAYLAAEVGIPLWGFLALAAVAAGALFSLGRRADQKERQQQAEELAVAQAEAAETKQALRRAQQKLARWRNTRRAP